MTKPKQPKREPNTISLRDYFAANALCDISSMEDMTATNIAEAAYEIADAMLEVRARS